MDRYTRVRSLLRTLFYFNDYRKMLHVSDLLYLSRSVLGSIRLGGSGAELIDQLAVSDSVELASILEHDRVRLTWWLNAYNALLQVGLSRGMALADMFRRRWVEIADGNLSLDDIEHGILRRGRYEHRLEEKLTLERVEFLRSLQVEVVDPRIHFALNCGATSCPVIMPYHEETINAELDEMMLRYVECETSVDKQGRVLVISRLFDWYAVDFGGIESVIAYISEALNLDVRGYQIRFQTYDWTLKPRNFATSDTDKESL